MSLEAANMLALPSRDARQQEEEDRVVIDAPARGVRPDVGIGVVAARMAGPRASRLSLEGRSPNSVEVGPERAKVLV